MADLTLSQIDLFSQQFTSRLAQINDLMSHTLGEVKSAQELLQLIVKLAEDVERRQIR